MVSSVHHKKKTANGFGMTKIMTKYLFSGKLSQETIIINYASLIQYSILNRTAAYALFTLARLFPGGSSSSSLWSSSLDLLFMGCPLQLFNGAEVCFMLPSEITYVQFSINNSYVNIIKLCLILPDVYGKKSCSRGTNKGAVQMASVMARQSGWQEPFLEWLRVDCDQFEHPGVCALFHMYQH